MPYWYIESHFEHCTFDISKHRRFLMPNTHRRRDETVLSRRRQRCEHNLQLAHDDYRRIRSTIWKLTKQTPSLFDYVNFQQ